MSYVLLVTIDTVRMFATEPKDGPDLHGAIKLYRELKLRFPENQGYQVYAFKTTNTSVPVSTKDWD